MSKDGGPAFPSKSTLQIVSDDGKKLLNEIEQTSPGMTLRDYFANGANEGDIQFYMSAYGCRRQTARYKHADDMLLERSK